MRTLKPLDAATLIDEDTHGTGQQRSVGSLQDMIARALTLTDEKFARARIVVGWRTNLEPDEITRLGEEWDIEPR